MLMRLSHSSPMICELDLKRSQTALFDSLVKLYTDAKREMLKSGPDPAHVFVQRYFESPSGQTLLDAGCGTGDEAENYERMGFKAVYGVDPSRKMLEQARGKVAHPQNFRQACFEHTGFPNNSFDAVVGNYSFHYVEYLDQGYRELGRILRPGALLLLSVRHPFSDLQEPDRFLKNSRRYVRTVVYDRVPVEHPMHPIKEYFSPTFLSLFNLIDVQEWGKPNVPAQSSIPFLLGYAARRRTARMLLRS
jgi:ubiquinone/menaquinone biosynthesis C-methylase UbiE